MNQNGKRQLRFHQLVFIIFSALGLMSLSGCTDPLTQSSAVVPVIDLNRYPLKVARGFEERMTIHPNHRTTGADNETDPAVPMLTKQDPADTRILPPAEKGRAVRIPEFFETDRRFLEFREENYRDYMIYWDFPVQSLKSWVHPALYLEHAGLQYKVYLNGNVMAKSPSFGAARGFDNRREIVVPLDIRSLKKGVNRLTIHIRGDRLNPETGLYYAGKYYISEHGSVLKNSRSTLTNIQIALYAMIGFFHIGLFFIERRYKYNLFFGLFLITMTGYLTTRTDFIYNYIEQTMLFKLESALLFLLAPAFLIFIESAARKAPRWIRLLIAAHTLFLILPLPFAGQNLLHGILGIWQKTVPVIILILLGLLIHNFLRLIRHFIHKKGVRQGILFTLILTIPGNLLIGTVIIVAAALFDIYNAAAGNISPSFTGNAFFLFIMGSAFRIAVQLAVLNEQVRSLNSNLRASLYRLKKTNQLILASESRYKSLVESSREIILSAKTDGTIVSANKRIKRELGISVSDAKGLPFHSLIDSSNEIVGYTKTLDFFNVQYSRFTGNRKPVSMKLPLSSVNNETHIYNVSFEFIQDPGQPVLIKAARLLTDRMLHYLNQEQLEFEIGNDLVLVEELSQRLARNLERYTTSQRAAMIRIGLRELLINAIEHGNLNISYEEKTRELNEGNYNEFIMDRQRDDRYRKRRVQVRYSLSGEKVEYHIKDEGEGFNPQSFADQSSEEENAGSIPLHGRGIFIAKNAFDTILYSDKGNEVTVTANFSQEKSSKPSDQEV